MKAAIPVGDALAVGAVLVRYYGFNSMAFEKIVRRTATQAITAEGTRYRLSDGRRVGDYGTATIATEAHYADMRRRKLIRAIMEALPTKTTLDAMTDDQLVALHAAITT